MEDIAIAITNVIEFISSDHQRALAMNLSERYCDSLVIRKVKKFKNETE
jgi:hypothetical protein